MVDYSKWNNFCDSDEDEEEEDNKRKKQPYVHHFEQPTSVTIGPNGPNFQNSSRISPLAETTITTNTSPTTSTTTTTTNISSTRPIEHRKSPRYHEPTHSWQQTRYDVIIWIPIPYETKLSEIQIKLQNKELVISLNSTIYFQKEFKYNIQKNSNDDDDIDWEVISNEQDYNKEIKFIFIKHQYLPETTIWWSVCFIGDQEIDVMNIPERNITNTEKITNIQSFSDTWKEANELFQKKIKNEKTNSIILEDEDYLDEKESES